MNRLDRELVIRNLVSGREKAKEAIESGFVFVNGKPNQKPSCLVADGDEIRVEENEALKYVSRGGLKLEHAISTFGIKLQNKTALDIGASTGGFTDCMLKSGAKKVYAVDVGHGQLNEKLRSDPRVINIEGVNARHIDRSVVAEEVDFISIDVSFISLGLVLPNAFALLAHGGEVVALIKPQFEAGRQNIGKNGIVKDQKVHKMVISDIQSVAADIGYHVIGITDSPILGGDGNKEYLLYLEKTEK